MLRFDHIPATRIEVPFEEGPVEAVCRATLAETLADLFPAKRAFFEGRDHARIAVHFRAGMPFGPGPGELCDLLFPDLRGDVAAVRDRFDLEQIEIAGLEAKREFREERVSFALRGEWLRGARSPRGGAVPLTAIEFRRLATLCREKRLSEMALLSVFIGPKNVPVFYLPASKTLGELFKADAELGAVASGKPERKPYDPFTGRAYDPAADGPESGSGLLVFSGSGYVLAPRDTSLVGFPRFGAKFAMRPGTELARREYPCSNCGACVEHCPAGIHPSYLCHLARAGEIDDALALGLERCIRCGVCSLVCPSDIDLHGALVRALKTLEAQAAEAAETAAEAQTAQAAGAAGEDKSAAAKAEGA